MILKTFLLRARSRPLLARGSRSLPTNIIRFLPTGVRARLHDHIRLSPCGVILHVECASIKRAERRCETSAVQVLLRAARHTHAGSTVRGSADIWGSCGTALPEITASRRALQKIGSHLLRGTVTRPRTLAHKTLGIQKIDNRVEVQSVSLRKYQMKLMNQILKC